MSLKVLVVYYSRSGNTRRVARAIATALPCEIEEIDDGRDRRGIIAYLRSGFEAWFKRRPTIAASRFDPAQFDIVVIGTPIWNSSVSSPVQAYLARHRARLPEVAFFVTYGGSGLRRVKLQLEELSGRIPRSVLALREAEMEDAPVRAAELAADIQRALAKPAAA